MIFRTHVRKDFEDIAELRWLLKTEEMAASEVPEKSTFTSNYREHLNKEDSLGQTTHWVIEDEEIVRGVMTLRRVSKETSLSGTTGAWGYLTNVFVHHSIRNQGHGTTLLASVISWAAKEDFEFLLVWPGTRSRPLYERAGFSGSSEPLMLNLK